MLHAHLINVNNFKKSSEDYIPVNTYKYLTRQIKTLFERLCEIDVILSDRTSIEPTEASQFILKQEDLSNRIKEYSKILETKHTVIEIADQDRQCFLGNGVTVLIGSQKKDLYLDVVATANNTISIRTPFGQAVFGKTPGSLIEFENLKTHKTLKAEIIAIIPHGTAKKLFFKKEEENKKERENGMRLQAS